MPVDDTLSRAMNMKHAVLMVLLIALCPGCQSPQAQRAGPWLTKPTNAVRFATFNAALSRDTPDGLALAIARGNDDKLRSIAEIIQRVRPDVLLINEFDFDPTGETARAFQRSYLAVSQAGAMTLEYPHVYAPRVNTGEPTGLDLNNDGKTQGPADAHGWGNYPGHYGMLVLSRYPLDLSNARALRLIKWADLPDHVMPADHYSDEAHRTLRLSSKTHADVPVQLPGNKTVHLLISHPTPPVFDGPEDRNGRRNHDEITLWGRYLDGVALTDDAGVTAALEADAAVVVLGDLNADPHDGDSFGEALPRLLAHPRLAGDVKPSSEGARQASTTQGQINAQHDGPAELDTADFPDAPPRGPGNLRVDYVLPPAARTGWRVLDAGVFWPAEGQPGAEAARVSDHRLVWVDLAPPGAQ